MQGRQDVASHFPYMFAIKCSTIYDYIYVMCLLYILGLITRIYIFVEVQFSPTIVLLPLKSKKFRCRNNENNVNTHASWLNPIKSVNMSKLMISFKQIDN